MSDTERPEYIPKYKWAPTWPGERCIHTGGPLQDFITRIDGKQAGRIRLEYGGPLNGKWQWNGAYPHTRGIKPITPLQGYEATAREACRKCEEYWDKMVASITDRAANHE